VIVIMAASSIRGTMPLYVQQLSRAGIEVFLVNPDEMLGAQSTIGRKITWVREQVGMHGGHNGIVFSDAFDVTFWGTKEDLIRRIPCGKVLQAAEKNCHPPECKSLSIPDVGPWRYANGGLSIGSPDAFLRWADRCEKHPTYDPELIDQRFMNMCLADRYDCAWEIDHRAETFFCLYGGHDELAFESGRPVNLKYGTRPLFVHANGQWNARPVFDLYRKSLERP
jgi:hypothetical protein